MKLSDIRYYVETNSKTSRGAIRMYSYLIDAFVAIRKTIALPDKGEVPELNLIAYQFMYDETTHMIDLTINKLEEFIDENIKYERNKLEAMNNDRNKTVDEEKSSMNDNKVRGSIGSSIKFKLK